MCKKINFFCVFWLGFIKETDLVNGFKEGAVYSLVITCKYLSNHFLNGDFVLYWWEVSTLQGKSHLCIPKKELRGLSPNFHIHVSVSDLYIPRTGLIWNLCFPVLRERTLDSTARAERRSGNCRQAGVGSSSLPSP
jgi:hypothetical protein